MKSVKQEISSKPRYCRFGREDDITVKNLHVGDIITCKFGGKVGSDFVGSILRVEALHANLIYLRELLPSHYDSYSYPANLPYNYTQREVVFALDEKQYFRVTKKHYDTHREFIANARRNAIDDYNRMTVRLGLKSPFIPGGNVNGGRVPLTHIPLHHTQGSWKIPVAKYHDVIIALVRQGKIRAIKTLRENVDSHISLLAAKEIVEAIDANMGNISKAASEVIESFAQKLTDAVHNGIISQQQYIDIAKSVACSK